MTLPKDILPQVTAAELDAFSTIGGEERLIAFVNRFRELERERIIKLLENRPNFCSGDDDYCFEWLETGNCDCKELIALIKGEQK